MAYSRKNKKRISFQEPHQKFEIPGQRPGRIAFSSWPMIFGWLAMLIFAFHASTHMVAAGDTWVAMACGRHFVNHGVDTVEPFSANSHKPGPTPEEIKTWPNWAQWLANKVGLETVKKWHPTGWVNQNWLTHVIFYLLVPKSSYADGIHFTSNALVYWKFAIYIITVICVYYIGRLLGVNPALSAISACFAMFVGRSFLDVRPQGFSNLLVAVFLLILALATYRNILYIWLIVPLTVFWCNVHGGYIYVFIMLVPFVVLNLITIISRKRFVSIGTKGIYHTVAAYIIAFIAMVLFNPYHLTNLTHTFIISVSKNAERWRDVHEWHPAFSWTNPVGTAFPLLVMCILGIGLFVLWLFSRLLKPRFIKAPRNELEAQKKLFTILSKIFSFAAAILIGWVIFLSFSLLNFALADFFISAIFVAILWLSIFKSVHFIYLAALLVLLALWSGDANVGYTGRYIYPFILLPAYVTLHTLVSLFSENIKFKLKNIAFVFLAAVGSLLLMTAVFNPFKFQMPLWNVAKQFFNLHRLWSPEYERNLELTYTHLFRGLYIVNIISIIIWFSIPYLRRIFAAVLISSQPITRHQQNKTDEQFRTETYQLPRIDLSLMTIAALTIYMAIRSRRFIPIAGIAACPLIVMFIEQIIHTISAALNFYRHNRLTVPPMPRNLQLFFTILGALAVIFFGTWWGLKFKRVYLDPWPSDPELTSVFMRMTASDAKPFCAGNFIKINKLKGKMFNYWTEGGFIAWAQEPDPNTGKTPLQLFMDGRAQAAYDRKIFDLWTVIMSGGPIVHVAQLRGHQLTSTDFTGIGQWIDQQLKKYNVWVVLMPAGQFDSPFVGGLEHNLNWPLVFLNNSQRLFVDITTPQGKELFEGIFNDKTLFPDEFSKNLTKAHNWLLVVQGTDAKQQGLDFAIKAFDLEPSPAPMIEIIVIATRFQELLPRINDFCKSYVDDFIKNKKDWEKLNGYRNRVEAARLACLHLRKIAEIQKNEELIKFYSDQIEGCVEERNRLYETKRW